MNPELGRLEKLDVRQVWVHEASQFTPWLAEEDNLARLGEALGLELEVESTEVAVGPYSADILARQGGTDNYVVIENQLGKTDHDHLGKLITYASVLNASWIVWIASEFNDEHRKALEWLNDNTNDHVGLFAVRLELWKVDDSRPAVRFDVISRPNQIVKLLSDPAQAGELSETKKLQLEFWTQFRQKLLASKKVSSAQAPRPQYWFNVPLGRSNIFLSNNVNTWDKKIGVRVYLRKQIAKPALEQLASQREAIEKEIGAPLVWDPNPGALDKTIGLFLPADLRENPAWEPYLDWMVQTTIKFKNVFAPRIGRLELENSHQPNEG